MNSVSVPETSRMFQTQGKVKEKNVRKVRDRLVLVVIREDRAVLLQHPKLIGELKDIVRTFKVQVVVAPLKGWKGVPKK